MNDFTDLVDLASETLGGTALLANDEFFAGKENLLRPHPPEWREHEYTDRGKWMDGWETRRRREPGFDWCVIRLGLPGVVRGVVVDTSFFRGNFPAECSLEGCALEATLDLDALPRAKWLPVLPLSALKGDHRNAFAIAAPDRLTHVRLNIFPDGGVARLRIHGEVQADWPRLCRLGGLVDLAALENGGRSILCSDMFFGSRNNLLLPGRPADMSSGWETRRRRGPGHDWNLVRLGASGLVQRVEIDTTHFKGNAPGWCSIEACDAPAAGAEELQRGIDWRMLLPETRTQPHTRQLFERELRRLGPVTHVRLNVMPDGGVARLRVWGEPERPRPHQLDRLNWLPRTEALETLRAVCGSLRWAERMADARPFEDMAALLRVAERTFFDLGEKNWLEAFAAHPRIGQPAQGAGAHARWSEQEQSAAAGAPAVDLQRLNQEYFDKFGFVFLFSATGRSGEEVLTAFRSRIGNDRALEIRTAAEEQGMILRLRLEKLMEGA